MNHQGQRTTFQDRLTMVEQAATGQTDGQIALALGCSVWTVRKWRRRAQQRGRAGMTVVQGRPATGPLGPWTPALGLALRQLRAAHPGWGRRPSSPRCELTPSEPHSVCPFVRGSLLFSRRKG
jgi:hypothetical protein